MATSKKTVRIAIMNVTDSYPKARNTFQKRMAVAYAWDKRLRTNVDYVTGRTKDGLIDEAWLYEGTTPTNEFYSYKGKSGLRREQWLLGIPHVSIADVIGEEAVRSINDDLAPGQYIVKYVTVDVEDDAA